MTSFHKRYVRSPISNISPILAPLIISFPISQDLIVRGNYKKYLTLLHASSNLGVMLHLSCFLPSAFGNSFYYSGENSKRHSGDSLEDRVPLLILKAIFSAAGIMILHLSVNILRIILKLFPWKGCVPLFHLLIWKNLRNAIPGYSGSL